MSLRFTKMHGLGNDFMVLDLLTQHVELSRAQIAAWGDRHTGVGFDQLLTLEPPRDPDFDFWYGIYNADGTPAEQCGNGARCVAKFIAEAQLLNKETLRLQSSNGFIETELLDANSARVNMGVPRLDLAQIPFALEQCVAPTTDAPSAWLQSLDTALGTVHLVPVNMGNPHGVLFVDNILEAPVAELGAELTRHPAFPEGANIGFCQVVDPGFVRLRVFERGVGETRACGTGACAAVVAGRLTQHLGPRVKVSLPGGKVKISWGDQGEPLFMSGPAASVYSGTIEVIEHNASSTNDER